MDLKRVLEGCWPLFKDLGYLDDLDDGGLKVLLEVDVRSPYVCIVGLCSRAPLERLSPRQREVLQLVRKGLSTKEIAVALRIRPRTVGTHLTNASAKLGVHSRVLLAQHARLLG